MPGINPELTQICKAIKVSDYLRAKGVEVERSGNKLRCCCPLPGHANENTPSFYISVMPDGAEVFTCFGCGTKGNIITAVHLIEGMKKKDVVQRLAASIGITLGAFDPNMEFDVLDSKAVDGSFTKEDEYARRISTIGCEFLKNNDSQDAVDKISRIYEMVDDLTRSGDGESAKRKWGVRGLRDVYNMLEGMITGYVKE